MSDRLTAPRREQDASLRRVERDAVIVCAVMAVLALVAQRGHTSGALGVIGGGALMAYSFRAIRGGVDGLVQRIAPHAAAGTSPRAPVNFVWAVTRVVVRYAVIGFVAWLLLVKLHAHPLGVFAGVTAPVVALAVEAVRLQRPRSGG
jgi:hypothetical protein